MTTLIAERITDFPALAELREDWRALSARVPENTDFFATWDYTWAYLSVHRPANWQVVAIRRQETRELVAVFPLQVFQLTHQGQSFRACQPLGVGYLTYIEFPVEGDVCREALQLLLNSVLQQALGIEVAIFWPLHQHSRLYLTLLEDLRRSEVLKTLRFPNNLHEIESRGRDFARYRVQCSSASYRNADYQQRRLSKRGTLRFTLSEPVEALRPLVERLCRQNQQKFGDRHAYRHLPRWSAFMPELVSTLAPTGLAEVSTLRLDGRVLASRVSFVYKRRRYFYLIDYDPEFAQFAPSKILNALTIEATFKETGVFCFGAGSAPYKRDWGPSVGELKAAIVFFSPMARAALETRLTGPVLNALGGVA